MGEGPRVIGIIRLTRPSLAERGRWARTLGEPARAREREPSRGSVARRTSSCAPGIESSELRSKECSAAAAAATSETFWRMTPGGGAGSSRLTARRLPSGGAVSSFLLPSPSGETFRGVVDKPATGGNSLVRGTEPAALPCFVSSMALDTPGVSPVSTLSMSEIMTCASLVEVLLYRCFFCRETNEVGKIAAKIGAQTGIRCLSKMTWRCMAQSHSACCAASDVPMSDNRLSQYP